MYFVSLIPNRGVVLDIGANIGIMTVLLAKHLDKALIYSFEPIPNNLKALKRVLKHYALNNVTVFETALGETPGELKMIVPVVNNANMQGLSHVVEDGTEEKGHFFSVPVQQLDGIDELKHLTEIVAIKMDVENFEYYVLKGGVELLRKHKPIIYCELWDNDRRRLCFAYMKELGYKVKVYENDRLVDFTGQAIINFFFLPAS
jgi:FkbM family methyltransferase